MDSFSPEDYNREKEKRREHMDIKSFFIRSINEQNDTILLVQNPKRFFEEKIHGTIIQKYILTDSLISCGNYTALILTEAVHNNPISWTATDYIIKAHDSKNPALLLEGAKMCFLLCSVFQGGRLAKRLEPHFYKKMGITMFFASHGKTKLESSLLMATHYDTMVDVVYSNFAIKKTR